MIACFYISGFVRDYHWYNTIDLSIICKQMIRDMENVNKKSKEINLSNITN